MWWQYRFDAEQLVRKVIHFLAYVYKKEEFREIYKTLSSRAKIGTCPPSRGEVSLKYVSEAIAFQGMPEFFELKQVYGSEGEESSDLMVSSEATPKMVKKKGEILKEIRLLKMGLKLEVNKVEDWLKLVKLYIEINDLRNAKSQ